MAVTFGRIGTTRLSGGARLVCTPDSQIAAPPADVTPNAVNWTDITDGNGPETNTQTISGINTSITLRIESNYIYNNGPFSIFVNGVEYQMGQTISNDGFYNKSVNNGDTIYFYRSGGSISETVTVKNSSDSNAVLDTFTITKTGEPPPQPD